MRRQWVVYLGIAMLAGAIGGTLLSPAPVSAVAREIVELQQSVNQLIQGQMALQTAMTENNAVQKTLIEQSLDSVSKLSGNMSLMQKTVQDIQANTGARLDSMSTQVQGVSDNLQETLARMGKLNQQITDTQTALQAIDAKLTTGGPPQPGANFAPAPGGLPPSTPGAATAPLGASAPSSDLLYSNGLRDLTGKKYDLAMQEFNDYLKYYSATDLASNAQFYVGEIYYAQQQYDQAVDAYSKVLENYPKASNWRLLN